MEATPILYSNILGALHLSVNPVFHAMSKHIKLDFHCVWERVAWKRHQTNFVLSYEQVANIFTKSLPINIFKKFVHKFNLSPRLACGEIFEYIIVNYLAQINDVMVHLRAYSCCSYWIGQIK